MEKAENKSPSKPTNSMAWKKDRVRHPHLMKRVNGELIFKVTNRHRFKLEAYLKGFYSYYPQEKFTVFHFIRSFKLRLKNNKDAWIAVSGETGSGKSLFVLMNMILLGRPMNLLENVAYIPRGDEIMKMFDKLNYQALLIDEAAREMRSVNWQSKQQQGVNTKAMTDRFKNNMVFLNMPNFSEFTKSMRRSNISFRCVILYRTDNYARVVVQKKSGNWRSDDPWYDTYASDIYDKHVKKNRELNSENILRIERALPNTIMDFIVPNLEIILPQITEKYDELKSRSRKQDDKIVDEAKIDKSKVQYEKMMYKVTKLLYNNDLGLGNVRVSKRDIYQSLGISSDKFNKFLKGTFDEKEIASQPAFRLKEKKK